MKLQFVLCLAVALIILGTGCDKSTEPKTTGMLSFSSLYSTAPAPAGSLQSLGKQAGALAVDSVRINRARFVLRDIKFKTQSDSMNYRTDPFVLELSLSGAVQSVSALDVPFNTYRRIEFDVHRVESPEISRLPQSEQAKFTEFLAGERYSIIIEGTVYKTGQAPQSFVFQSKINAKQKIDLQPELVVSEAAPTANVTMLISSANWFKSSGVFLDPTDAMNEIEITENLKSSIRVYKDNNRDGLKDPN
mgnify:FL=1